MESWLFRRKSTNKNNLKVDDNTNGKLKQITFEHKFDYVVKHCDVEERS